MTSDRDRQVLPYEKLLRAVGAKLDDRGACSIYLLEEPAGFSVRYQTQPGRQELAMMRLETGDLLQRQVDMERKRARIRKGRLDGARYQDFLRALGYELEQRGAYSILVDELDEGYLVTYQYLRPHEGYVLRKEMVVAGPSETGALLEHAHARRQSQRRWRFLS